MNDVFRKKLREELDYQDLTVKELSAKTNIAKGSLDGYLGARAQMPPADVAVKIAAALGVTVEYLLSKDENYLESALDTLLPDVRAIAQISSGLNRKNRKVALTIIKALKNLETQEEDSVY